MALVEYFKQTSGTSLNSAYANAHKFTITVPLDNNTSDADKAFLGLKGTAKSFSFTGIIDEIPTIEYSTTWGDSPAAVLNEKLKKFTQNKWIRMFAQQSSDYVPPLMTDGWTQQIPKAAEPLNVSLKFRAYPDTMYGTTFYPTIIKGLIFMTTPKKFRALDTVNYFNAAALELNRKGEQTGKNVDTLVNAFGNSDVNLLNVFQAFFSTQNGSTGIELSAVDRPAYEALIALNDEIENIFNMNDEITGGCPLIKLKINGLLNDSDAIKWLLKSWSFKPAVNVTRNNNPIYTEFNVSLQTQYILGVSDLAKILES